ncbi:MAG: carbon-nitrogen hydrolase family protein [Bryobacteraceae bacterium]
MRRVFVLLLFAVAAMAAEGDLLRLGLFTAMPVKWDLDGNWRVFERTLATHASEGVQLVVTPECFLDGYVTPAKDWTPERFAAIAQDAATSVYIKRLRELAAQYKIYIVFGLTENRGGKFYNTALLVDRAGNLAGRYSKTHLQNHDLRYAPGDDLPVFDTPWGKVGILICADRRWPETARVLRLKGARIVLIPSYGMWGLDNEWWMRTRAYENENFLAFAHPQVAFVADPNGAIAARLQSNVAGMLVCDVDLSRVSDKRHIKDRRPELYGEIVKPK